MKPQLALYKGKGTLGNALVRWWTLSRYSHCELIVNNMWYSSSLRDGGVRAKSIVFNPEHWDLIPLPDECAPRIIEYYERTKGHKYSILDLLRSQIFNSSADEEGAAFCSEWCASAALGIPNPSIYSPQTLSNLVVWTLNRS